MQKKNVTNFRGMTFLRNATTCVIDNPILVRFDFSNVDLILDDVVTWTIPGKYTTWVNYRNNNGNKSTTYTYQTMMFSSSPTICNMFLLSVFG